MQKVVGSSPIIRSGKGPGNRAFSLPRQPTQAVIASVFASGVDARARPAVTRATTSEGVAARPTVLETRRGWLR